MVPAGAGDLRVARARALPHSMTSVTTPAPTVRPFGRMGIKPRTASVRRACVRCLTQ